MAPGARMSILFNNVVNKCGVIFMRFLLSHVQGGESISSQSLLSIFFKWIRGLSPIFLEVMIKLNDGDPNQT